MRVLSRTVTIAAVLVSLASMACAAEVRVLSVGAPQHAVRSLAADFGQESGHQVNLTGVRAVKPRTTRDQYFIALSMCTYCV